MNQKRGPQDSPEKHEGLEMYFSPDVTERFAELEQNDKNFQVAEIVDRAIIQETRDMSGPICVAELGGGAHPDRYHSLFSKLLEEPHGHIDWVDVSPYMLELAEKYLSDERYRERKEVITFVKCDILEYLHNLENEKLDLALMKYTIDHIESLDELFGLLAEKMKRGGKLIATISSSPELKSYSTNARFLYNGEEFPEDEVRMLKDGEHFTVKFFKVSGDPSLGYLEGAETVKYFHSAEGIKRLADTFDFDIFLGGWKDLIDKEDRGGIVLEQEILILTKR